MNTTLLEISPALPDRMVENRIYYQLEKLDLQNMPDFLAAYCKYFRFGSPFFGWAHLVSAEPELWNSTMEWGIVLSCRWKWSEKDTMQALPTTSSFDKRTMAICVFHEIIHLFLTVIGYPIHDEKKIEKCSKKLANTHPQILTMIEEFYPGFSVENPILKRRFYHRSIAVR